MTLFVRASCTPIGTGTGMMYTRNIIVARSDMKKIVNDLIKNTVDDKISHLKCSELISKLSENSYYSYNKRQLLK